jgi:hypothetical protein
MFSKSTVVVLSKIDKVGCAEEMSVVQGLQMRGTYRGVRVQWRRWSQRATRDTWTMRYEEEEDLL